MPPKKRDITKYSSYFAVVIPGSLVQAMLILLLGVIAGAVAGMIVHGSGDIVDAALLGAGSGILVISVPALLTVLILRTIKRGMKIKHAMFAVLAISLVYAAFIVVDATIYYFLRSRAVYFLLLILINAAIYGYWFIINRIAIGQKKIAIITSQIQTLLNIFLYLPFGGYIIRFGIPIGVALTKLFSGILVFLVICYVILYLLDMPAKKNLYVSSVQLFSTMIGQWLYDLNADTKILGTGGVERDVDSDVVVLSSKKGIKAVMVKPDIHYGPFGSVGGSIFTKVLGDMIVNKYGAAPFILHGAVNIDDNPISTRQVTTMSSRICDYIGTMASGTMEDAFGMMKVGSEGPCRAINMRINGVNILTLTKAPTVTEDIDREVGLHFEKMANCGKYDTVLIDAHNSRFETAPKDDLRGIYRGSKYVKMYDAAIREAVSPQGRAARMNFGSSYMKLSKVLRNPDLGTGYSSIGVFKFGTKKFAMVYIDANNVLPGFRESVIRHVKAKYGIDAEVYSTDTHSVNSIALSARNSLGRYTKAGEFEPLIDTMIERAMKSMEEVSFAKGLTEFKRFRVWGKNAEELITKVGMEIINIGKYVVPVVIVGAFIIAGWIIYVT